MCATCLSLFCSSLPVRVGFRWRTAFRRLETKLLCVECMNHRRSRANEMLDCVYVYLCVGYMSYHQRETNNANKVRSQEIHTKWYNCSVDQLTAWRQRQTHTHVLSQEMTARDRRQVVWTSVDTSSAPFVSQNVSSPTNICLDCTVFSLSWN